MATTARLGINPAAQFASEMRALDAMSKPLTAAIEVPHFRSRLRVLAHRIVVISYQRGQTMAARRIGLRPQKPPYFHFSQIQTCS